MQSGGGDSGGGAMAAKRFQTRSQTYCGLRAPAQKYELGDSQATESARGRNFWCLQGRKDKTAGRSRTQAWQCFRRSGLAPRTELEGGA